MVYGREYISLIGNLMKCVKCGRSSVIYQRYSGRHLCADHLCADVESRAKRVIRQNRWLVSGDRIGVVSGLPGSAALGIFLDHLVSRRDDISIVKVSPCQFPGARGSSSWYRALSPVLLESGVTRLALPECAEDLAKQTLHQIFSGDADALLSPGVPGLELSYMQPFREIPAEELHLYVQVHTCRVTGDVSDSLFHTGTPLTSSELHSLLGDYSSRHPSASHTLRRYRDNLRDLANRN